MRLIALQSGSNGNCLYVEGGGVRLLVDAGISGKQAEARLAQHDIDIRSIDALLISHDHSDHVRSAGIFHRKFGLTPWMTTMTHRYAASGLGTVASCRHFAAGRTFTIGDLAIHPLPTPHDAVDGVGFVIDDGTHRLGLLTDLGHAFTGLHEAIADCHGLLIESNYDPEMLRRGSYPPSLKARILSDAGHLSNAEAAACLAAAGRHLTWAVLGHLSENNNCPALALKTHRQVLGTTYPLHLADRYAATGPWDL